MTDAGEVDAILVHAVADAGSTSLRRGDVVVRTPEHLLAALRGAGITDAELRLVGGAEVPILDGSAAPWFDRLRVEAGPAMAVLDVEPLDVVDGASRLTVTPGERGFAVDVSFDDGPRGSAAWDGDPLTFGRDVAWARTFVLARDVEALRRAGRGRGADPTNTLVWGAAQPRQPDEPVVHKLLDLVGDVALLPPLRARVLAVRGSHRLHLDGLRRLRLRSP